jgi:hypothetical protein
VRNIVKPASMVIVDSVNIITPAASTPDQANSKRTSLERASLAFIDATWPLAYDGTSANVTLPRYYAALSDTAFRLGGTPDAAYICEFVGTTRAAPMSSGNQTTYLGTNLPDLFNAAAMVFACGQMKNFGAQADNPQMALSWETTFTTLKTGAAVEEARKQSKATAWTSQPPSPGATPPRS